MADHQLVQGTEDFEILEVGSSRSRVASPPQRRVPAGIVHACDEDTMLALCGVQCAYTWAAWPPGFGDHCEACAKLTAE